MAIKIHRPRVELADEDLARLVADVEYNGIISSVWFSVPRLYCEYLCYERSDAFLIGILNWALRTGDDIECEAPVSEELLFQIREYLVPSLVKYDKSLCVIHIDAVADTSSLPCAGAVGTGMSCGIDSLHVLQRHSIANGYPGLKLTHLTLFNVGAYRLGSSQMEWQVAQARKVAKEVGLPLIETNSNIAEAFPRDHHLMHTYSNMFGVYALRKLWKVYYYGSSGMDYGSFSLKDNSIYDAARYELLSINSFSITGLKIYSEGAAITKFDKVRDLKDFELAHRYLHVCVHDEGGNCNVCGKCRRQLLMLDALGIVDDFKEVFDVGMYKRKRSWYMRWLVWNVLTSKEENALGLRMAYQILKKDVPMSSWIEALLLYPIHKVVNAIRSKT